MDNKRYDAYGNEFEIVESDFNLTQVDKKIHDKKFETKATTFAKDAFKRFCKNKSSVVGAIIIGLLMLLSFILPVVSPYNIDPANPNIKELKMLPKVFEYKPSGTKDTDLSNNPNDWNTKWNGTQIITNAQYDVDAELPYTMGTATNVDGSTIEAKIYYSKEAVKEIDFYGYETNSTSKGATGGVYIFKAPKKNPTATGNQKNTVELIVNQKLNYTADENFTVDIVFGTENYNLLDDFKELGTFGKAIYRVYVSYVQYQDDKRPDEKHQHSFDSKGKCDCKGIKKELELRSSGRDLSSLSINVSDVMKQNNLEIIEEGQLTIQIENDRIATMLPIVSLMLKTDSTENVNIYGHGEYAKQDVLNMMSMTNDGTSKIYDDACQKLRWAKLNTGVFPIQYWRTNGDKAVYRAYVYLCDFLLDTYENTYGVKETLDITEAKMKEYMNNGWCEYKYYKDQDGNYQYEFKVLDPEKCPVVNVKKVNFAMVEMTQGEETVEVLSQQLTCDVVMYKYLGYESMPKYLLGTDDRGFDIIVYSFNGLKKSFLISIIVSAICLSFGLVWGSISGYFGGNVDLFMERFCEILSGVPSTIVITLVVLLLGDTIFTFGLALCMTGWLGIAGRTRTQFYRFKGREYILASRTLGSSDMRLIFKHILPNSLGTIVTSSVLSIPSVIFSEASLSYLGILKGSNSFGSVLSHNQQYISTRPMLIVFPAIIISLIMISFNLFGNGLRDALNPSLKGSE